MVPGTGSPAPDATAAGTRSQDASASAVTPAAIWSDVRASRGRDVPNSRPLPEWVRRFSWLLDDAFPVPGLRRDKYFPPVRRIDNAYGDRHLVCTCPPVEEFED